VFSISFASVPEGYVSKFDNNSIKQYLKNNLVDKNIIYSIVPMGIVISVPTLEIFEDGHNEINENAKALLLKLGSIIKYIGKNCVIEGNALTQQESDEISNLELSIMRADKLVEFFIKNSDISPSMIRGLGFGDMAPFSDNVSYKKHLDKRVDFIILNYEWSR
jgi:flagellar motor protein MotB